jgi:hypothetical protein
MLDLPNWDSAQTPFHDITQHRGARLVKAFSEIIHLRPRHRVKAGVHADAIW